MSATETIVNLPLITDTRLAKAHEELAKVERSASWALESIHHNVGDDRKISYQGRKTIKTWGLTDQEAINKALAGEWGASYMASSGERDLEKLRAAEKLIKALKGEIETLNATYAEHGWSRFFIVKGGHIHSSMNCHSCTITTDFGWLPELSGKTEAEAVEAHGALLCTFCYPSAPTEWTNGREVEAAAKKATQCEASGSYYDNTIYKHKFTKRGYYVKYVQCGHCGEGVSVTSTGKLRAHKPKAV